MNRNHIDVILGRRDTDCANMKNLRYQFAANEVRVCKVVWNSKNVILNKVIIQKWNFHLLSRPEF